MSPLTFRQVTDDDYPALYALNRDAFWAFWEAEATVTDVPLLVDQLRTCPAHVPELNLVAERDGEIVGHIMYTRAAVGADDGIETEVLTFGPLAVAPREQGGGVGRALMEHSFEVARGLGFRGVFIFGHPDYYPRVGFRPASELGVTTAFGSFDAFMGLELFDGALAGVSGVFKDDDVFHSLTNEAAVEFDRQFPPREPHRLTPLDGLLAELNPEAAESIKGLGKASLDQMTEVSEREARALPGIGDKEIAQIKAARDAIGKPWGR